MAKFQVIAYKTERYEMTIEAADKAEAMVNADTYSIFSDKWTYDYDSGNFEIVDAEKLEEENEDDAG